MLNFSTQKTMRVAQQLYEGVDVKGSGTVGIITYLRTDSTRISDEADASARAYIEEQLRRRICFCSVCRMKKSGKKIQDAHEAIRPTDITRTPVTDKRIAHKRSVPSVSADLETICGKPYGNMHSMRRLPLKIGAAGLSFPCICLQDKI